MERSHSERRRRRHTCPRGADPCSALVALDGSADTLASSPAFDAAGYRELGKDFRKAAKTAPKELRSARKKLAKLSTVVGTAKNDTDAINACGKGLVKYDAAITQYATYLAERCAESPGSGSSAPRGVGRGHADPRERDDRARVEPRLPPGAGRRRKIRC